MRVRSSGKNCDPKKGYFVKRRGKTFYISLSNPKAKTRL